MKRIIDTREILGIVHTAGGPRELCATAWARYDDAAGTVTVHLDSFLRSTDYLAEETHDHADWLPKPQIVREAVDREDASDLAREVFHVWVRRIRNAAPALHEPST